MPGDASADEPIGWTGVLADREMMMMRSVQQKVSLPARGVRHRLLPLLVVSLAMAPATAHAGFFEQLFGMQPAPEAQPPAASPLPNADPAPRRRHRPVRQRIASEIVSGRQTPTDLMHDKTLRRGDAVMMKGGFHIFQGARIDVHTPGEFVPLDRSGLPHSARVTLAAVDTMALAAGKDGGPSATGRSAAIDGPEVVAGSTIVDPRGRQVRYIGP